MSKWKIGNCEALKTYYTAFFNQTAFDESNTNSIENTLGASLRYQVPKNIPTFINFVHSGASFRTKFAYTSRGFQQQRHYAEISIMPALCLMLQIYYYAQNYAGI